MKITHKDLIRVEISGNPFFQTYNLYFGNGATIQNVFAPEGNADWNQSGEYIDDLIEKYLED